VCEIECSIFPAPWSRQAFETELSESGPSVTLVAERAGRVIAYFISWVVVDELHIGNLAVDPAMRSGGVATALLSRALEAAARRGVALATLEVRVSNRKARGLYAKFGFKEVAIRRGYYSDNGEDALVMLKAMSGEDRT
jgi:ribosomal-protein-alanine N-acetyltransferase